MKIPTYLVIVFIASVFLDLLVLQRMSMSRYAYGEERNSDAISEDNIIILNNEYVNKQKGGGQNDAISEQDIITLFDDNGDGEINLPYFSLVSKYMEKGEKHEARNLLSELYFKEPDKERRSKIKEELDKLNNELVFSKAPSKDAVFYVVKGGDTLSSIASIFKVPYKSIMRINKKNRSIIREGERLKILNGELTLLVDKSDFTLTVLLNGRFIKQYPVGIGMMNKTPEATFLVKNKLENPTWYSPDGVYKYGDPRNLLGSRWMGFEDKDGLYGYGIHGTKDPASIGKAMSNGCIRLSNKDVEELYDYVGIKTKVVIQK